MTVRADELAARDAAERRRVRRAAIANVRRGIEQRRAQHGRTDCLERNLARLLDEDRKDTAA